MAPPIYFSEKRGIFLLPGFCSEKDALAYLNTHSVADLKILQDHTYHSELRSDEMLRSLIQRSPDLVYLSLANVQRNVCWTDLKKLEVLEMLHCSVQNLFGLLKHAKNIKTLRVYNLQDNDSHQGSSLSMLSKLETVSFYGKVDYRVILSILQKSKKLKKIHLGGVETLATDFEKLLSHPQFSTYEQFLTEKSRQAIALYKKRNLFFGKKKAPTFRKKLSQFMDALPSVRDFTAQSKVISCESAMNVSPVFSVSRVFFSKDSDNHPCPSMERMNVFSKGSLRKNQNSGEFEFVLEKQEEEFVKVDPKPIWGIAESKIYAKFKLEKTKEWQYLPSLSRQEQLTHLYIEGMNENEVHIERGIKTQIHRIKIDSPKEVYVHFSLQAIPEKALAYDLPHEIREEIKHLQSFTQGVLQLDKKDTDSVDSYIEALHRDQVGPCLTRAFLLANLLWKKYPEYSAYIVENVLHYYVEMKINQEWFSVNLGGYPAKLNIVEPEAINEEEPLKEEVPEEGPSEEDEDELLGKFKNLFMGFNFQKDQAQMTMPESSCRSETLIPSKMSSRPST